MADEPIVVPRTAAEPAKPEEDFETKARAYVRDRYGIEDEPDAFRTKHRTVTEERDRWAQTAQYLGNVVKTYQGRPQQPAQPVQQPQQPDPAQTRELWRIDPYEGYMRAQQEFNANLQSTLARHAQGVDRMWQERSQGQAAASQWVNKQYEEFPESWDPNHDLHKLGRQIFSSWSPQRQAEPDASYLAASAAAAQLGLAPKAKRRAPVEPREDEVESQSADRGSKRPTAASETKEPRLTAEEKRMAKAANVDAKVFAQMKLARKDKKNVRSDD